MASCTDWTSLRPTDSTKSSNRVINCAGSHFEIGRIHGIQARHRILAGVRNYAQLFEESVKLSWTEAKIYGSKFIPALENHAPHLLEEMRGIAHGAQVSLEDILALNARSEIALTQAERSSPPDGCTAFSRRVNGQQWLQQNWDWKASQLEQVVVLRIQEPTGKFITTITEAGIVAKVGMNSAGVAVTLNALKSVQMDNSMLPIHIALRLVLESDSVQDAIDRLEEAGVASAAHFLISDSNTSMGLEVNPVRPFGRIMPDSDGNVFHTNHCIASNLPSALTEIPWLKDSPVRLSRVTQLVNNLEETTFDTIFSILQDQRGLPNAINRDVDPIARTGICTVFTIIMNCSQRRMRVTFGRPTDVIEALEFDLSG